MKKIVLASAAMGGAALVAFGASGTFAAFSDQASSGTEAAGAGTLYLSPGQTERQSAEGVVVEGLAPGDEVTYAFYVNNDGSLAGDLTGTFRLTGDTEGGCLPVEGRAGDPSCTNQDNDGELPENTNVRATYGPVESAEDCTPTTTGLANTFGYTDGYTLASLNGVSGATARVPGGEGFCAVVTIQVDEDATNVVQSDQATFKIDYRIDQV